MNRALDKPALCADRVAVTCPLPVTINTGPVGPGRQLQALGPRPDHGGTERAIVTMARPANGGPFAFLKVQFDQSAVAVEHSTTWQMTTVSSRGA
jgi:hypothetical protein